MPYFATRGSNPWNSLKQAGSPAPPWDRRLAWRYFCHGLRVMIVVALAVRASGADFSRFDRLRQDGPLYPMEEGGKFGYIDKAGHVIVEPHYTRAGFFS